MKRLSFCSVLALAAALSGCSTMREAPHRGGQPQQDISNPEEANNDMTRSADANAAALAPCLPSDNTVPKIKPKPKPIRKRAPPPQPPAPQVAEAHANVEGSLLI